MSLYSYDINSGVYDQPALIYPALAGVTVNGAGGPFTIPISMTAYTPVSRRPKLTPVTTLPILSGNYNYGGTTQAESSLEIAKLSFDGTIDTPCIDESQWRVSNLLVNGVRITYAELIIMCMEGRVNTGNGHWNVTNPTLFRDPYGRVWNNPQVIDVQASFVESVPGRNQVSIQLAT